MKPAAKIASVPKGTVPREVIMAGRTEAGGWTRETLRQWGVPWPPPKGWLARLSGEGV